MPNLPACTDLVTSLQRARQALSSGDSDLAGDALTCAYSDALEFYSQLDPSNTRLCSHVQGLIESCIVRIDDASRGAGASALTAALQLLRPLESVFPR